MMDKSVENAIKILRLLSVNKYFGKFQVKMDFQVAMQNGKVVDLRVDKNYKPDDFQALIKHLEEEGN